MIKVLQVIFTIIITSFYFFPFEFSFLPGANTKMILAGLSLLVLGIELSRKKNSSIDKDLFQLSIIALGVSLITYLAVVYNGTCDYTYVSYIISMWVWMGGAYLTTKLMKLVHGYITIELICNYLIVVCTFQCLLAYSIDLFPAIKNFVDSFLGGTGFMGKNETRMYGVGCALDVAGSRFAVVLVMIAYLSTLLSKNTKPLILWGYLLSFMIIAVVGNMMSRSTFVGVGLALFYFLYSFLTSLDRDQLKQVGSKLFLILLVGIPSIVYLYHSDVAFKDNFRFAFEGFFSLVEKGRWEVHSNEILKNMYVFPDNVKTWLIGDGYFDNPYSLDPYYVGPNFGGFYMATDVGYLRFLFYFGIFGLLTFIYFIFQCARVCMRRFSDYKLLFALILLINYIIWFKVASDIFLVFALFLCVSEYEQMGGHKSDELVEE